MIIGLTINDNDFGEIMETFAGKISMGLLHLAPEPPRDAPLDVASAWFEEHRRIEKECLPALKAEKPSEEQKQAVMDAVKSAWEDFVAGYPARTYLSCRLQVTVPDSVTDEWQNGEQYYVFPSSYHNKVLCF